MNSHVHSITPDDTETSPGFDEVWSEIAELIGDRLVVAHNTSFDMSILKCSAAKTGYTPPQVRYACSCRLAKARR